MRAPAHGEGSRTYRQHPVAMLRFTHRYLYLLLVPILRGLPYISAPSSLYVWVQGAWIDLAAIVLLLILPVFSWCCNTYTLEDTQFILRRGIVVRRTSYIPRRHIATLLVERPFYLRPLGAVHLSIDTEAGNRHQADFRLTVSRKQISDILEQQPENAYRPLRTYHPRLRRMFLLSLLTSNSFSGMVLLAITFQRASYLLGQGFQNQVLTDLETVAGYVTFLPRTAALLALAVIAGWCVGAVGNLLRHAPFRAQRCAGSLSICTGFITRREYSCTVSSVNYADFRQSLFSRLLKLHMVFINCIGYGKVRNTMAVFIPACGQRRANIEMRRLLPEFSTSKPSVKPVALSLFRYCRLPLCGLLLLRPLAMVAAEFFPQWQDLIGHLTFMAYLPFLWLLAVKAVDRYTAGVSYASDSFTLRYSRHFTLHTVVLPREKLVMYQLRQSIFQRYGGKCDLRLYTYNEYRLPHSVRNLPLEEVRDLLNHIPSIIEKEV